MQLMKMEKEQCDTMNILLGHTAHFYQPLRPQALENKEQRLERMRRSRSVPKLNQLDPGEVLVNIVNLGGMIGN